MDKEKCAICGMQFDITKMSCPRCGILVGTEMPSNPFTSFRSVLFFIGIVLITIGVFGLLYGVLLGSILVLFIGLFIALSTAKGIIEESRLWLLAKKDHAAFMKEIRDRYPFLNSSLSQEMSKVVKEAKTEYYSRTPNCPICGNKTSVRRLSNVDRTISTAVWGAASSAIGKQWECTSCKHRFNVDSVSQLQTPPSKNDNKSAQQDAADELRKYKQMLDDELITQEDYDTKKKQILGI